jgi:hypothetical protein
MSERWKAFAVTSLYLAILNFQKKNLPQFADGHVDPGGRTLDAMERTAKVNDLLVSANKAISDAAEKAARYKAKVEHAVDQMVGNEPGSETWVVTGSDAPLSGAVPFLAGPGVASVTRIPIPGTTHPHPRNERTRSRIKSARVCAAKRLNVHGFHSGHCGQKASQA